MDNDDDSDDSDDSEKKVMENISFSVSIWQLQLTSISYIIKWTFDLLSENGHLISSQLFNRLKYKVGSLKYSIKSLIIFRIFFNCFNFR